MSRLNYNEIKTIITEKFGLKTLEDYKKWLVDPINQLPPTAEEIDLLSPDNVNCVAFWKVCDDLFGTDPVCNRSIVNTQSYGDPLTLMDSNRCNLWIAKTLGVTAYIDEFAQNAQRAIVEIGAGFGSLKNYIESTTKNPYFGFDVVPRVPGVYPLTEEGTFPESITQLYGKIQMVVSTNVFQHLSVKQRLHYFDEAAKLLIRGGLLIFNGALDQGETRPDRTDSGDVYIVHYGQRTPHMKLNWIKEELHKRNIFILMTHIRCDNVVGIIAQYRPVDTSVIMY